MRVFCRWLKFTIDPVIVSLYVSDIVAMHVEKNLPREEALQFPTTIAVNAFRSYLDEYLKRPKKKRPKPKPSKQHQQAQKTNVKKKTKEVNDF